MTALNRVGPEVDAPLEVAKGDTLLEGAVAALDSAEPKDDTPLDEEGGATLGEA